MGEIPDLAPDVDWCLAVDRLPELAELGADGVVRLIHPAVS